LGHRKRIKTKSPCQTAFSESFCSETPADAGVSPCTFYTANGGSFFFTATFFNDTYWGMPLRYGG
jgi:hypothetical protein